MQLLISQVTSICDKQFQLSSQKRSCSDVTSNGNAETANVIERVRQYSVKT